jgi:Na+-driven multidrug efflux pump
MIIGLGWGVMGAALATFIGHIFGDGYYILHLLGKKSILSIHPKDYSVKNRIFTSVVAIGIPASLTSILMTLSNILTNNFITGFGDMAMAGFGVATKVAMITGMILIGIGQGVQPLLGFCVGARRRERFHGVLRFSVFLVLGVAVVMSSVCFVGARAIITSFIGAPEAVQYGIVFARIVVFAGPGLGLLFLFSNAIQAMGAARPALILSVSRQGFVYIPVLLLFHSVFHTFRAIAVAQVVSDFLSAGLAVILCVVWSRKLMKNFAEI